VAPHRYQAKVLCCPLNNNFLHFYSDDVNFTIFGVFIFTSLMDMGVIYFLRLIGMWCYPMPINLRIQNYPKTKNETLKGLFRV
ncbi:hypothetical protein P4V58_30870, partial [Bacillus wiedmannii]|nr:hypothetical protein [Bacillus wiedmannii]